MCVFKFLIFNNDNVIFMNSHNRILNIMDEQFKSASINNSIVVIIEILECLISLN